MSLWSTVVSGLFEKWGRERWRKGASKVGNQTRRRRRRRRGTSPVLANPSSKKKVSPSIPDEFVTLGQRR